MDLSPTEKLKCECGCVSLAWIDMQDRSSSTAVYTNLVPYEALHVWPVKKRTTSKRNNHSTWDSNPPKVR